MFINPGVEKALKGYHPDLVLRYNPQWTRETNRFYVCQCFHYMREIDERIGLYEERVWEYPVLGVDQATEYDRRWFQALTENRWDHDRRDPLDILKEDSERKRKAISERVREFATGEGWHAFKPFAEQFNMANVRKVDPTRETKARQDLNGRENMI